MQCEACHAKAPNAQPEIDMISHCLEDRLHGSLNLYKVSLPLDSMPSNIF